MKIIFFVAGRFIFQSFGELLVPPGPVSITHEVPMQGAIHPVFVPDWTDLFVILLIGPASLFAQGTHDDVSLTLRPFEIAVVQSPEMPGTR